MQPILGQSNQLNTWGPMIKVGLTLVVFVLFPLLKQLKLKADEKAKQRRQNNLQREAELEAIRTGRGLEQVMSNSAGQVNPMAGAELQETDDPKARRERQLAELRRRAAGKAQAAQVSQQPAVRLGSSNSPVPMLTRTPQTAARQIQTQAIPGMIQMPGTVPAPVSRQTQQRPMQQPVQRPVQRPVQQQQQRPTQKPPRLTAEQARQQAQRMAAQRQPVPGRQQVSPVSDVPDQSETHRLVADSDAAKVTARQGRRGPVMGKAGIRQAMIMTEILGRPRSERLDEI